MTCVQTFSVERGYFCQGSIILSQIDGQFVVAESG